ncbi:DUF3052 domain-containing protein [Nocardioides sp.]|uniref:DUF3052 domain-containing protein n=1 Tax=Nocardioides sp. TaxID=35761 RepID=UPI002EDB0242
MAGYSGTPLVRKLGIRDGQVVHLDGLPDGLELGDLGDLGDLGTARVVRRLPASSDVTLTFHTSARDLARRLPILLERTGPHGMVWVCWPKKAAQRTLGIRSDLDENVVRDLGLGLGWVDVKIAAIDDTWSGLKFVRRLADR